MKDLATLAAIAVAFVAFGWVACGCPLHDPVPCPGDPYPAPCVARDAGRE
jgi:hypothetical protein